MTTNCETRCNPEKKTLLEKYQIPIDHLDFQYINNCEDAKEIERIVRILRSAEEGCFPELQQCAEKKLTNLKPNSTLLRVVEKVLTKDSLPSNEWDAIDKDLADNIKPAENPKEKRINGFDYKSWDKFDADTECLKLDLEDEKVEEERQLKKQQEEKKVEDLVKPIEEQALEDIKGTLDTLDMEERKSYALKERIIGNEFFKEKKWKHAIEHYTRSIYINATLEGYSNRAATYLKECEFAKALDDLNIAVEMAPSDVKVRYRRAICLQHKNRFHEALDDILMVVRKYPHDAVYNYIADQLRESVSSLPKMHRIEVKGKGTYVEVTGQELKKYKDDAYVEVNQLNYPILCPCEKNKQRRYVSQSINQNVTVPAIKANEIPAEKSKRLQIIEVEKTNEKTPRSCIVTDKRCKIQLVDEKREKNKCEFNIADEKREKMNNNELIKARDEIKNDVEDDALVKEFESFGFKPCGCSKKTINPFDFATLYSTSKQLSKEMVNVLKSICPEHLPQVIGHKLDDTMLKNILKCLLELNKTNELKLIERYCQAISKIERISIIKFFLDKESMQCKFHLKTTTTKDLISDATELANIYNPFI